MDEREKPQDYDVGYRKPPAATRFKKGQSGNPKGRPKGKRNASSVIMRALWAKVVINENGRRREVTKFEAAITQLSNKAAQGDLRALNLVTALMRFAEERVEQDAVTTTHLQDADGRVLQGLMQRLEELKEQESNESQTVRQND
jgi:Family of unknown function (DUF5681)